MRYSFISSAALVTTLLATSGYYNTAVAQKAALLAPVTQWAVTKVDANAKQGGYCAMARRFKQNTILTVARNDANETSLALDFQTPKLKTGDNIKIVLDPGAGEQRSYYISPVSQSAFVVRLGRDEPFFTALQETGYLRIDANGQSYSFDLADIDSGNDKLQGCVGKIGGAGMQQANNSGNGISGEIESLRRDVQSLKKENQRLASVVQELPPGEVVMPDEVVTERIVDRLGGQARTLETQNEGLRYQRENQTGVSAGQTGSDVAALGSLRSENVKLAKQLAALTVNVEQNEVVQQRIAAVEEQNRGLRMNVAAGNSKWQQNETQINNLQEQNRRLQQQLNSASEEIVVAQNEAAAANVEKQELKNILEEVQDAAKEPPPMPEEEELAPAPDDPAEEAAAAASELAPAPVEAKAASAQPSVDELMAQIREKDEKLVELSSLQAEVEELKKKNAELESKMMNSVGDKQLVAELTGKIRTLEEENNRLIQQMQNNPSGTNTPKDEQISALTAENSKLQQEINALKAKSDETEALRSQLTALQAEHEALKNKPPEVAAAATPDQIAQIDTLTKENAELKAKVESLTAELKTATESKVADGSAPVSNGQTCTAEVGKAKKVAEEEKQIEMATLAKENMTLKQKLAQFMGGGAKAAAPAEAPADITAEAPVETKEVAPVVNPPEEISNIVASDYPPPAAEAQTEAQRQEAEMMNSMKAPAAKPGAQPAAPPVRSEDIKWNQPAAVAANAPAGAPVNAAPAMPPADNSAFSIQDVLVNAQIAAPAQIQKVEKASGPDRSAYQWKSGAVYGSAEQKTMGDASQFDSQVQQYLDKTKKRCAGDFAASPDNSWQNGPVRVDTYEIACIGGSISSTASLAFINKGGSFTVVAHEASADRMSEAMTLRDRIVKSVTGS